MVVIIIAILAVIAIATFLGQRQKARDAAAKSLIRNAATAIETGYVDEGSFVTTIDDAHTMQGLSPLGESTAFGQWRLLDHPRSQRAPAK